MDVENRGGCVASCYSCCLVTMPGSYFFFMLIKNFTGEAAIPLPRCQEQECPKEGLPTRHLSHIEVPAKKRLLATKMSLCHLVGTGANHEFEAKFHKWVFPKIVVLPNHPF